MSGQADTIAIKQLQDRVAYLHSQEGMGIDMAALQQSQSEALCMTFTTLANLDLSCISKVTAEIKTGPWTQAQRTAMATSMIIAMTTNPTQATGPRGCQKCVRFDQ